MYLKQDITGPYSQIEYGKKGDKVNVLNDESEMILVELNGVKFHVKMENLSIKSVPIENLQDPETKPETKQYQRPVLNKKEIVKPLTNQNKLF